MSAQLIYPQSVHHNGSTFQADVIHVAIVDETEQGACRHGEMYYQVSRPIVEGAEWEVTCEMDGRQVSERVGELYREFKSLQHSTRNQRLPLRHDAPVYVRMDAIKRECAAYGVNTRQFLR